MIHFVHQYSTPVELADGILYVARAYAGQQPGGLWEGWFVFFPLSGGEPLVGDRETTQSKLEDVVYWAGGIEPVYLEGALVRVLERLPDGRLARQVREAEAALYAAAAEALAQAGAAEAQPGSAREHPRGPAAPSQAA
ncbi:MAG TPA: hypothetical protein VGX21_24305 [Methylomirabilota bacterium]|jgi:hypothetical protein|nr:hypothetical protein [Methylomirabilota bacterium]